MTGKKDHTENHKPASTSTKQHEISQDIETQEHRLLKLEEKYILYTPLVIVQYLPRWYPSPLFQHDAFQIYTRTHLLHGNLGAQSLQQLHNLLGLLLWHSFPHHLWR